MFILKATLLFCLSWGLVAADTHTQNVQPEQNSTAGNSSTPLHFTKEEQDYISHKKEILICDFADWMPYVGENESKFFGIVYDYYQIFGEKIGLPVRFVHGAGTEECAKKVASGEADAIASIDNAPNTYENIVASNAYGEDFLALVTQIDEPFVSAVKRIEKRQLAVLKHYKNLHAFLLQIYPNLNLVYVDSTKEGFEKVAKGELYGFINIYRVAAYAIRREYVGVLKINTKLGQTRTHAHAGVRSDNEVLRSILNKAIASVPYEKKQLMIDHWMRAEHVVKRDYRLLAGLLVLFMLILLGLFWRQYKERQKQKRVLEKQEKLAGMGTMINNIAHQWRQPLNRINSNVAVMNAVLESDEFDPRLLQEKMDNIKQNTKYMSDTIEDFIHFFHPSKVTERFSVEEVVAGALDLMGARLKGLDVKTTAMEVPDVYAFKNELQQVILIILHNAVDNFAEQTVAEPKIEIEIKRDNENVMIVIGDNGGGISSSEIEKIFEPYYTTKFVNEGTGLGLYMAKMLVESSMGGKLTVRNKEQGACFEIEIPQGESHA